MHVTVKVVKVKLNWIRRLKNEVAILIFCLNNRKAVE